MSRRRPSGPRPDRQPGLRTPRYRRLRKKSGRDLAFVELNGARHYLGRYNSSESHEAYHRLVAEWHAHGRRLPLKPESITVVELIDRFREHAERYYRRPDGSSTGEFENFKSVLCPLNTLYGRTPASEFGPRQLKAVRFQLVDRGLARTTVNAAMRRLRQVFRWAASEEIVPASVLESLRTVPPLKRGRTEARETDPVRPVHPSDIDAIRRFVSRQVWTLVQIQLLTGARSGEILPMRAADIDMAEGVWVYRPPTHKNSYRGQDRRIYLGPRCQRLLRPFITGRPLTEPLFSPAEAEEERLARRHRLRVTPLEQGNVPGDREKLVQRLGRQYDTRAFARAIRRACEAAKIEPWSPHRLRHTRATEVRRQFGLEVSRAICGHKTTASTEIYAELDHQKAMAVMREIG